MHKVDCDVFAKYGPFGRDIEAEGEAYLASLTPTEQQQFLERARRQMGRMQREKGLNQRPRPSTNLISNGDLPTEEVKKKMVDMSAHFADQFGPIGRSQHCVEFAAALRSLLEIYDIEAKLAIGKAKYKYAVGVPPFEWDHAWLEIGNEIVDCNVDVMHENPRVPEALRASSYWGLRIEMPQRQLSTTRYLEKEREGVEIHESFPRLIREFREFMRQYLPNTF